MEPVPDPPAAGAAAACRENRVLLAAFLREGLTGEDDRRFREHLLACAECGARYRESISSAAQLGRALRRTRRAEERERRHEELVDRARAAGTPARRGRRFGLRLVLLPVAFICLLVLWSRLGEEKSLIVRWDAGEVRAAGQNLSADRPELELTTGDWCLTRGEARARIEGPVGVYELGTETQLVVEDPDTGRIRLQQGDLLVSGACIVSSAFGVLEMRSGRARVGVRGGSYELDCLDGEVTWTAAAGSRRLAAGERLP